AQPAPAAEPQAPAQPAPTAEPAATSGKADLSAAYRGIVKIEVATRKPDYATPWQTGRYGRGNGTGFMVSPGLFMTNAHVVADAERIYISPYADARKLKAHVKYVAHDADLALIEVEDASAFADVPCLEFSDTLPRLEESVRAIGYPIGGNRLSVTRGIVSRIDTTVYAHPRNVSHLTVQVDAAINPGNSGGPVLMGDKVVGVAFQGLLEANSTGYMIPMPVIKRFLKDVEDGHYDTYVDMGVSFMPLINPAMRKHYNLPDNAMGTLVAHVVKGGCSDGALQPGDVVLSVNGHPVDSSAMIALDGERVQLEELAERAFKDDTLTFTILRNGTEQQAVVRLAPLSSHRIMGQEYDAVPRYVHFGGLIVQPLHRNVIVAHSLNSADFTVELDAFLNRGAAIEKQDILVLTKVLKDEVNARFNDYGRRIITKVNGVEVKGLTHLHELLYPADGQRPAYTVIEFAGARRPLVIDNAVIDAANARISAGYNVPAPACLK
ncbi:MAG: trypsin-like peptidase domain-containing protein, partial [Akkermansia sp.]|nr:trypsin-like peptidase domain-containing protein [Akkermansia sp.]